MNTVKTLIQKSGFSRKKLAHHLGVTVAAISNYEKGIRKPKTSVAYKCIDFGKKLGVTLHLEDIYPREK